MTTQRGIARRPGATAPRRQRRWADKLFSLATASTTGDAIDLSGEFTANETAGLTVVRMILCYTIRPNNPGAASGNQLVDVGIGLFEAEAFAAGVLPDVQSEADYPRGGWLYRCRHNVQDDLSGVGTIQWPETNKDIRSQRRLGGPDVALGFLLFNGPGEGTAFSTHMVGIVRTLFLLP